jgi:hypothetical protein
MRVLIFWGAVFLGGLTLACGGNSESADSHPDDASVAGTGSVVVGQGQRCDDLAPCGEGLACVEGTCALKAPIGAPCQDASECIAGACRAGRCAEPLPAYDGPPYIDCSAAGVLLFGGLDDRLDEIPAEAWNDLPAFVAGWPGLRVRVEAEPMVGETIAVLAPEATHPDPYVLAVAVSRDEGPVAVAEAALGWRGDERSTSTTRGNIRKLAPSDISAEDLVWFRVALGATGPVTATRCVLMRGAEPLAAWP